MLTDIQIECWSLDRLLPYAANARTHSEAQVAEIAGSMRAPIPLNRHSRGHE